MGGGKGVEDIGLVSELRRHDDASELQFRAISNLRARQRHLDSCDLNCLWHQQRVEMQEMDTFLRAFGQPQATTARANSPACRFTSAGPVPARHSDYLDVLRRS